MTFSGDGGFVREQASEGGGEVWVCGQVEGMLESDWVLGEHVHPEFLVGAFPFVVRL
mgnify:CR=1 FL=1